MQFSLNISVALPVILDKPVFKNGHQAYMIKNIQTHELCVGMYVQALDCTWIQNPFLVSSFKLKNEKMLTKILSAGITHASIDTALGLDTPQKKEVKTPQKTTTKKTATPKAKRHVTKISKEETRARGIYKEGTAIIRNMMEDVRLGKQVEVASVNPVAENIVQSIFRNSHALTGISRIKTKDDYTFMHCVSVTGLMVMFSVSRL